MMSAVLFSKHGLASAGDTCSLIVVFALVVQFALPCHCDTSNWYNNPCATLTPNPTITERPLRHTRNAQDGELNYSIEYFKKSRNNLTSLYEMKNVKPMNVFPCLNKTMSPKHGLRAQYRVLVKYAVAMQKLRDWEILTVSHVFDRNYRNEVYTSAMNQLKRYMCEVCEKLKNCEFKAPRAKCLRSEKPMDFTDIKIRDVVYFKKLIRFLKSVRKIRKRKNNRKKLRLRS